MNGSDPNLQNLIDFMAGKASPEVMGRFRDVDSPEARMLAELSQLHANAFRPELLDATVLPLEAVLAEDRPNKPQSPTPVDSGDASAPLRNDEGTVEVREILGKPDTPQSQPQFLFPSKAAPAEPDERPPISPQDSSSSHDEWKQVKQFVAAIVIGCIVGYVFDRGLGAVMGGAISGLVSGLFAKKRRVYDQQPPGHASERAHQDLMQRR